MQQDQPPHREPEDEFALPWPSNYFNYFTEIEEHFQQARGTSLFLLSPLDWALIESWKNAGVPLEAVLRGIDAAFEKWRGRKSKTQQVNSIAYCAQAVMLEAQRMLDAQSGVEGTRSEPKPAPFTRDALLRYLQENARQLAASADAPVQALAASLGELAREAAGAPEDLGGFDTEDLERRLSALESKLLAHLRLARSEEALVAIRRELDAQLRPYRSRMNAVQLRQLEDQYFERKLLEQAGLPRLSLFYLTDYGM